jgi:signal transduction histidine kinase
LNKLLPPVHIEQLTADGKDYPTSTPVTLPPRVRNIRLDYTALSLANPQKVQFRYKLEGYDKDWNGPIKERQATYTNLRPGNYRFRVVASNNSGIWNESGTALDLNVMPAFYQTNWFLILCLGTTGFLAWQVYRWRVRQVTSRLALQLEVRLFERTRIARELHDTLLQSFHGLLLRFQTVNDLLPTRPDEAKKGLVSAIDQAAEAITEGRDAVQGLRLSTLEANDLAIAIRAIGEELAADQGNRNSANFQVEMEGTPRNLHPILRDDVYRIAAEALRNAFRHAQAQRIEVEIRYDEQQFRLRVRDDGKGMDAKVLVGQGRTKHWGLHGMQERAKLVGGRLDVWSEIGSGTEIELNVPASSAYSKYPAASRLS